MFVSYLKGVQAAVEGGRGDGYCDRLEIRVSQDLAKLGGRGP